MADIIFTNNASSLLAASIDDLVTTIQVGSGDGPLFPSPSGSQYFVATLEDDAGNIEIVQCTSRTGDILTVVRGFDNSTAQSFALTATRIELRLTAIVMKEFLQANGDTLEGDIDANGNSIIDAILSGPLLSIQGGESVGTPMRGATGVSSNEVIVPAAPGRATAGGADIVVATDDITSQVASATESVEGIAEIADQTETDAGTDDVRFITPLKLNDRVASEILSGILELADQTETDAGTDDARAITPLKLNDRVASEILTGILALASQAEVDAGTVTDKAVTPATLSSSSAFGVSGAKAFGSANQSIATGASLKVVAFNSEAYDTDTIHDNVTDNSRLTVPTGATRVRLTGYVKWQPNGSSFRRLKIRKNGAVGTIDDDQAGYEPDIFTSAANASVPDLGVFIDSGIVRAVATDFFELQVSQESGLSLNLLAGDYWFQIEIIE